MAFHPFNHLRQFKPVGLVLWSLIAVGLLSCVPFAPAEAQACSSQSVQSGWHCKPLIANPWVYWTEDLNPAQFPSMDAVLGTLISRRSAPPTCSFTMNSLVNDVNPVSYGWPSVPDSDIQHTHRADFTHVWTSSATPCEATQPYVAMIYQARDFSCPPGWGMAVGKCVKEYWQPDLGKEAGGCSKGQIKVGNPCEIGSGNKYLQQSDYRGAGVDALALERHYNSNNVINYATKPFAVDL